MQDIEKFKQKLESLKKLVRSLPPYTAVAAEKMKDANFAAQGFVVNGTAAPRWKPRKKETARSLGKRILHSTGLMQKSVKANALANRVTVGIDLTKVPYAKAHNDGGRIHQYVRPHHRMSRKGKRHQVKGFSRVLNMPQRKFLGYTPDIFTAVERDIKYNVNKIFN